MSKILSLISILSILTLSYLNAQPKEYVAKIGDDYITAEEFKQRFELMPLVSKNRNLDSLKHEMLYTLIAENLFAKEAVKLGFDTRPQYVDVYSSMEKLIVRDALFNEEIEKKIKIGAEELKDGLSKVNTKFKVNIVSSTDSSEIYNFYSKLQQGGKFDSLFRLTADFETQVVPPVIGYGDMSEKYIEDAIFKLTPGNYSEPLKTKDGWFLFYSHDRIIEAGKMDIQKMESRVKDVIRGRKRRDLGVAYMTSLLKNLRVTPDSSIFMLVATQFAKQLQPKDTVQNKTDKDFIILNEADLNNIKAALAQDLKKTFVPFDKKPSSLNDFINFFYHTQFKVKSSDFQTVASKVNYELRSFIEKEIMAREGFKKGLDKLPNVKRDLKMWSESYLAQMYRNSEIKSLEISDDEIIQHYNEEYKSGKAVTQVKIAEIITEDLSIIEEALNRVNEGKEFTEVANELSSVKPSEPQFIPVTELGEKGRIAAGLNAGDVYGPMKSGEQYVLFKLLEKKDADINMPETFEQVKEVLRNQLMTKKLYSSLMGKTAKMSENTETIVNEKVLSQIKVTGINMFAYRYIGFGGRISAVPYTAPFHEWIHEAKKIQKILP